MVKFGVQFASQQESQYDDKYLRYKLLKKIIKKFADAPDPSFNEDGLLNSSDPLLMPEACDVETQFRTVLEDDIVAIRSVLRTNHRTLWSLSQTLQDQVRGVQQVSVRSRGDFLDPLRSSLVHLCRSLVSLQSFVILNYIGLSKILKKHDKRCAPFPKIKSDILASVKVQELVHAAGLSVNDAGVVLSTRSTLPKQDKPPTQLIPPLDVLIDTTEQLFADLFENGNIPQARIALLSKQTNYLNSGFQPYRVGMQMGVSLCLFIILICLMTLDSDRWAETDNRMQLFRDTLPIFSCFALVILVVWMWALNVHVWGKFRINFVFLLELDPRTRLVTTQLFDEASRLSLIYLLLYCCYMASISLRVSFGDIPDAVFPMTLTVFFLLKMFWPFDIPFGYWETRKWVLMTVFKIMTAPFHQVRFKDVYVADVICSLVLMLGNLQYTLCYFVSGYFMPHHHALFTPLQCRRSWGLVPAFVSVLPLWWRFWQCLRRYKDTGKRFPNLANALKYALTQVVSLFGAFHPDIKSDDLWQPPRIVWMVLIVLSTFYTFLWDVLQDWSLFQRRSKNNYLRNDITFPKWAYYVAIPADFVLRFVFVLTIIPYSSNPIWSLDRDDFIGLVLPLFFSILELFRRCMWGMIRLENEHINNKEGFREITPIPALGDEPQQFPTLAVFKGSGMLVAELLLAAAVLVSVSVACYFVMQT